MKHLSADKGAGRLRPKRLRLALPLLSILAMFLLLTAGLLGCDSRAKRGPATSDDASVATSGTWGTCPWHLDNDNMLIVEAGVGEDTKASSPWSTLADRIVGVRLEEGVVLPADCSCLFMNFVNARGLYASGVDASNATRMVLLCSNAGFEIVEAGDWDVSGVTDFSQMFAQCTSLKRVDASNWDMSSATLMTSMFQQCESLVDLDVSRWDVTQVKNMARMFSGCKALQELDVSRWDVSRVCDAHAMFFLCLRLTSLDVSHWNVSSLKDASQLFSNCESLEGIDVTAWDTSGIEDMSKMFQWCRSLRSIDLSGWNMALAAEHYKYGYMFRGCDALERISVGTKCDFSRWDTFPDATSKDHPGQWYSQTDRTWYDMTAIIHRSGIADTYTNSEQ